MVAKVSAFRRPWVFFVANYLRTRQRLPRCRARRIDSGVQSRETSHLPFRLCARDFLSRRYQFQTKKALEASASGALKSIRKNGPVVLEREAGSDLNSTSGTVFPKDAAERGRIPGVRVRVVDTGSIENIGYIHADFKQRAFSEPQIRPLQE